MNLLSPAPEAPNDELTAGFERLDAFSTLDDLVLDTDYGASASLIYVEGDVALYLDNYDADLALQELDDRDITIIAGLVRLAEDRVVREQARRRAAQQQADKLFRDW